MKKIKIGICIGVAVFAVILFGTLLVFSLGSGQRGYHSSLSGIDIQIPRFSLFAEELQDGNVYTVEFKMLGSEEHITEELRRLENENYGNTVYEIEQWAVSDSTHLVKTVIITYVRK